MRVLDEILALPEGTGRTAALVAWVQGLFAPGTEPVLVGGGAVELYTGGAYTSGDIDLVGTVPTGAMRALRAAGFSKQGRNWVHERSEIFLEFPSSSLHEGETAVRLLVEGVAILTIAPEDLIAERLAAWQHWRSAVDGVNAWLVFRTNRLTLDRRRLSRMAKLRDATPALRALRRLARRETRREVSFSDVEQWALCVP